MDGHPTRAMKKDPLLIPSGAPHPLARPCPPWCTGKHPASTSRSWHFGSSTSISLERHEGWLEYGDGKDDAGLEYVHLAYATVRLGMDPTCCEPAVKFQWFDGGPGSVVPPVWLTPNEAVRLAAELLRLADEAAGVKPDEVAHG